MKVYRLWDRVCDWYTGAVVADWATYEGRVYILGLGWFETWLEDGEHAYRSVK